METAPRPVIPLEYAQPTTVKRARWWWLASRWGVVLSGLCLFVGWVLMFVDVETVIVTGPILFLFGLTLALSGWRLKLMPAAMLGIGHCSICVLFFTLVNVRGWSPREAELPFQMMAGLYLVFVTAPASALVLMYMHAKGSSWFSTSRPIATAATRRSDANRP
jgi:hypothetical protein